MGLESGLFSQTSHYGSPLLTGSNWYLFFFFFCHNKTVIISGLDGKESAYNAGDLGSILGSKIPWRREWLPTLVFLPGESQGKRSLVGHSPCGHKDLDTTENHVVPTAWQDEALARDGVSRESPIPP